MSIEVLNESDVDVDAVELIDCARFVLGELRVHPAAELCITLVDEPAMANLHEQWMGEAGPTDVMSFPMDELRPGRDGQAGEPGMLGDVVACPQVAAQQAAHAGHTTAEELLLLVTHGVLHLLGFDHADPKAERDMFDRQRTLLLSFLATRGGNRP
ncbi:MAG TPA: rRNA maturation RNase YbeY [Dermatophilaceae bacterium]|nr:rRNA maturation RNase YbeY [Dermatophilaceae bacterium]